MVESLIGLAIVVFVSILTILKNNETQKKGKNMNTGHGENFPFPSMPAESSARGVTTFESELERWLKGDHRDEPEVEPAARTIEAMQEGRSPIIEVRKTEADDPAARSIIKPVINLEPAPVGAKNTFKIDLRQAIIYSEILTPKYKNDNF